MIFTLAQGDFGVSYPINLYTIDGKPFTQNELSSAQFELQVYRIDTLAQIIELADTKIYPKDKSKIFYYKNNHILKINDEVMTVQSISVTNQWIQVIRDIKNQVHKRKSTVYHVITEDTTMVEYNTVSKSVEFTPKATIVDYPGTYYMMITIVTPERRSTCIKDNGGEKYILKIKNHLSEGD